MRSVEERVINELRAELDLVPGAAPGPLPERGSRWPRYLAVAAAVVVAVVGSVWLFNRPVTPLASEIAVVSVTGDSDARVIDMWEAWWTAWAEVRETATAREDGMGFDPSPLEDLAIDRDVSMEAISDTLFAVDEGGGPVGAGEPTEIRLAPDIRTEADRATINDCVYLDPIPWVKLRQSGSAGTVRITAELELTTRGWRVSHFRPESLLDQLTADDFCRQPSGS